MPPSAPPPDWVLARRRAIGDQIRAARLHQNLTQEQLAERCGMDRQAIGTIESGEKAAKIDSLIVVAEALQTPLAELMPDTRTED